MDKSLLPRNEPDRLRALRALGIDGPGADAALDDIAQMAAIVLSVPIAAVSIVGANDQFFRGVCGLNARSTSRDISFCTHTILNPLEPLIVEDATTDDRFRENPLVTGEPFIRFYTGIPLLNAAGYAMGSLCVIDRVPRTIREPELEALRILARQAVRQIEQTRLNEHLAELLMENAAISDRLRESEELHRSMLECVSDYAIYRLDENGHVKTWNLGAQRIKGYTAEQAIGKHFSMFFTPELRDAGEPQRMLDEARRFGRATGGGRRMRSDGSLYFTDSVLTAVRDVTGKVIGFTKIARDVTSRVEAERRQRDQDERLRKITSQVPGVVYQFKLRPDGTSCFPYASRGIEQIYRVRAEDVEQTAKPVLDRLHPDDFERVMQSIHESARTLEPWQCEYRVRFDDGIVRWLSGNAVPNREEDGSVVWHGFITDVTEKRQNERALRRHESLLRTFIEHTPAAVAMFDKDMRYLAVSRRWLEDYRLNQFDLLGRTHYEVFPEIPERWKQIHRRCLAGAHEKCEKDLFIRVDGRREYVRWEIVPWYAEDGQIGGIIMFTQVVTAQVLTEERSEQQRILLGNVIDLIPYQVYWKDARGRYLGCNRAFARALGLLSPQELLEKTDEELHWIDGRGRLNHDDDARVLATGTPQLGVVNQIPLGASGSRWIELNKVPLRDARGQVSGVLGVCIDVTDQYDRARELERARDAACAASRAKSDFLANMSHEIRTPLSAILGFADLIEDDPTNADAVRAHIQTIQRNGEHLLGLINDVLDYSKIESSKMTVEQISADVAEIARDVIGSFRARATEKGLRLDCQVSPGVPRFVLTDPMRLRQILMNLVGNAIKFTESGGVRLRVDLRDSKLCFDVVDSGIGIDRSAIPSLFKPFVQADSSMTRRFGGTGLGLTISRRLAELMGGELTVRSTVGVGSRFRLTLPAQIADARPTLKRTAAAVRDPAGPRVRVLAADDSPDNRLLLGLFLDKLDADAVIVEDGQAAVDRLRLSPDGFDLILLDMQMPVLDGFAAVGEIRKLGFTGPIAALTAHALNGDERRCLAAGCSHYLTKPIDIEKLRMLLDTVASNRRAA